MYQQTVLPRWKGFNLPHMIATDSEGQFYEKDFQMIADLGFDFIRLPLNYKLWIEEGDWNQINDSKLEPIDQAVYWGEKYSIHVNISFHRGPGYSISTSGHEPYRLFFDQEELDAFILHWKIFAKRYKNHSAEKVSYNLLNEPRGIMGEPAGIGSAEHAVVMRSIIKAVREIDREKYIILDGIEAGQVPPTDLFDFGTDRMALNMRAYVPNGVTHYKATWDGMSRYDHIPPSWPYGVNYDGVWNRERLILYFKVWAAVAESSGMGLHCGEGGCFNQTPHAVTLRWLEDVLSVLKEMNTGLALWDLRGAFGILDSGRRDVDYEDYKGHKLDRKMYELFLKY